MSDELPALDAETWIAAVAHDLRDPMNAIVGMTELLLDSPLEPDQRRCAETVRDAAHTMTTLVNDLLDLSRLQRGDLVLAAEAFDLGLAVRRTLDLVRPRIGDRPVVLRLDTEPDPLPWVVGDPGRLRQILVNLLANALTHTPGGEVRLEVVVRPAASAVTFTVTDTGHGIDAEGLVRMQQPFVRLRPAAEAQGLGLGLAIVQHLVARMGGTLTFTSTPKVGTAARLMLPLAPTTGLGALPLAGLAGRRIALAGAPPPVAERLAGRLQAVGAEVVVTDEPPAADGARSLAAVLLACDRIDARAAASLAAWRRRAGRRLPVVALVACGLRGEAATARQLGFAGYLPLLAGTEVLATAVAGLVAATPGSRRRFLTLHGLREVVDGPWDLLVVDDNPMNLRLLDVLLTRSGHRVETAADGAEALARAADGGLDAILMDVQMPVMSGTEAARAIRRLPGATSRIPIVAVTANALEGMAATCAAAGMDGFVTKPIDPVTLAAELHRVIVAARSSGR